MDDVSSSLVYVGIGIVVLIVALVVFYCLYCRRTQRPTLRTLHDEEYYQESIGARQRTPLVIEPTIPPPRLPRTNLYETLNGNRTNRSTNQSVPVVTNTISTISHTDSLINFQDFIKPVPNELRINRDSIPEPILAPSAFLSDLRTERLDRTRPIVPVTPTVHYKPLSPKPKESLKSIKKTPQVTPKTEFSRPSSLVPLVNAAYYPDKFPSSRIDEALTNNEINSNVNEFLDTVLSLSVTQLELQYDEAKLIGHIKTRKSFNPFSALPVLYDSYAAYKQRYFPLIVLDSWAQLVADFWNTDDDDLQVIDNESDSSDVEKKLIPTNQPKSEELPNADKLFTGMVRTVNTTEEPGFITLRIKTTISKAVEADIKAGKPNFGSEGYIVLLRPCSVECDPTKNAHLMTPTAANADQLTLAYVYSFFAKSFDCSVKLVNTPTVLRLFGLKQNLLMLPVSYFRPSIRYVETLTLMGFRVAFEDTFLRPKMELFQPNLTRPNAMRLFEEDRFNEQQKNAIVACVNAVRAPFATTRVVMLQGPPGTGKTHTLVGIIKNLFVHCSSTGQRTRLLVCTPSNGAIDEVALRLIRDRDFLKKFENHDLKIVRLGQKDKVHSDVRPYLLNEQIEAHLAGIAGNEKGRQRVIKRLSLLMEAEVILSTLSSCQHPSMSIFRAENASAKCAIRCVIVDEASQCTEPELLMPLIYPVSKVILIGDHLQLPATVISDQAQSANYGRSMFERLHDYFEASSVGGRSGTGRPPSALPLITLNRQFRMHLDICTFPSDHFYESQLQTPANTGVNATIALPPYVVLDLANARERSTVVQCKSSKCNPDEVVLVGKLLTRVMAKLGYSVPRLADLPADHKLQFTIGIITFYRGQKQELERKLRRLHGGVLARHVDVNTVDAFQGQERDIVILSCVRALDITGSVGFVRSQQRMNVALTRAKSALFVCLHRNTFANVDRWKQLIDNAHQRNRLHKVTKANTDRVLNKVIK